MVDHVVELIFIEIAETVEHEVPFFGEAGEVGFLLVFLFYLVDEFIELIDIVWFFLGWSMLQGVIDLFLPFIVFLDIFLLIFLHLFVF